MDRKAWFTVGNVASFTVFPPRASILVGRQDQLLVCSTHHGTMSETSSDRHVGFSDSRHESSSDGRLPRFSQAPCPDLFCVCSNVINDVDASLSATPVEISFKLRTAPGRKILLAGVSLSHGGVFVQKRTRGMLRRKHESLLGKPANLPLYRCQIFVAGFFMARTHKETVLLLRYGRRLDG
jgi:hypothetical protein